MQLSRRHKYILWSLGIYWPALFLLTHIPVPKIAGQSGMTDDMMHMMAYLILVFFVWMAISPYDKVRWNRVKVWIILAVIIGYGVMDEWIQGRVGRQPELSDVISDSIGAVTGLAILSVLSFWPALMTLSIIFIFVITNCSVLLTLYPEWYLNTAFHLTAYTTLTLLWIQSMDQRFDFRHKLRIWPLVAIGLPLGLLALVKLAGFYYYHKPIWWVDVATAVFGVAATALISQITFYLTAKKQPQKLSAS